MQRSFLDLGGGGSNHKKKEDRNIDGKVRGSNGVVRGSGLNPSIVDVNVEVVSKDAHHRNTVVVSAQDSTKRAMWDTLNQEEGSNDVNTASDNLDTSTADLNKVTGSTTTSQTSTASIPNVANTSPDTTGPSDVQKRHKLISYANKISSSISTKANLQKTEANVPNDPDYDIWLPLASVNEKYGLTKVKLVKGFFFLKFSSLEGIDSVIRDGPWMIRGIPVFLIKWSPSMSLLKEVLSRVLVWVKFHDVPLVAYTSDRLSLIATKINTPMILDLYTNSMYLESWERDSYARVLSEISLNVDNVINEEVAIGSKATTSGTQEDGQSSTPIVEKINVLEKRFIECKLVLVDDDEKPLENVDYPVNSYSDDEVEPVENETTNFLASNRVGYGPKNL
ncbi:zinc knuckle CX2CX4HX4C containing protein [Tanacetum coccineum]|uniref:Zinc knuckle CX2CX4HX4C containing protein n=1 Tax=Tanacetum coccineum TaxID=301880 RepID=A0ABQ4WNN5_9ASTR